MSDHWGFVVAGYLLTAVAIGGYSWRLWRALRRAERDRGDDAS